MGRMDWTLDEPLDLAPSDQWDANPRSPSPDALEREITFPGLGVCIPSGSRPSTPELSAAGSDSDPVSSSPASVFTPLSPFMPFSSAFSATSVSMESRMDEPAYPLLDCTSLSRVDHRLALDTDGEGATSMYAQDISVSYPFEGNCQQSQAQAHTLTLETNTNPSPDIHRTHPSILSLPPASFSLPASTRPTPAAKSKKSTTKKAGSGATSNRVHDLGRRIKERRGVVDVGGAGGGGACADAGTGAGSVSVVSRAGGRNYAGASKWNGGLSGLGRKTKRGARGKFVSNTTKTKERLVTGLGSGLRSGSGFSSGRALEVGRGCDERVSEDASQLVDHDPIAMADALSQASYPSIEQHERAEDLAADVGAGSGVASTSGRKSREKAFKCPLVDKLVHLKLCPSSFELRDPRFETEYMPHKEDMHSDLFVARCVYPYLSVDISDGREVTLCDFISGRSRESVDAYMRSIRCKMYPAEERTGTINRSFPIPWWVMELERCGDTRSFRGHVECVEVERARHTMLREVLPEPKRSQISPRKRNVYRPRPRASFPAPGTSSTIAPNSFSTIAMDWNGIPAAPVATHIAQCPST
ncbi:uncharacterized protein STEHIDRAFT_143196 [Stereum hirsutum FP-91666 SS1]|uniref:Uncharacterized protein n=1 Tax=Stereum hirsutum (strain FP-91666) TaxID=721885 RepID=R7RYU3_STEHR|nr:uncharacterized protein STEHIDRAFT_143196 [Stereum hirsutum FP-91666 SS1]EIM79497.1 hypothetical protein STEHIDRAFT_143196 [Stereum hirsutum FP-91666 SS1]